MSASPRRSLAFRGWRRLKQRAGALPGAERGATALEFALVATPYIIMVMAAFELCFVYALSTSLDSAVAAAARQIMTGQLQNSGTATSATFKTQICNNLGWLASECQSNLSVNVQTFTAFGSITQPSVKNNGAFTTQNLIFNMGAAGDIVMVNAYYQWPLMTPYLSGALNATGSNQAIIESTFAFRNEPYG